MDFAAKHIELSENANLLTLQSALFVTCANPSRCLFQAVG